MEMNPVTPDVVIRRMSTGWQVADLEVVDDLSTAMVLADLLSAELQPGPRPERPAGEMSESERLALVIKQLEHALAARVTVEQAIGVLAERLGYAPRPAFELLRKVARSKGKRVHELAAEVVGSVLDGPGDLPAELLRRSWTPGKRPPRRDRRNRPPRKPDDAADPD